MRQEVPNKIDDRLTLVCGVTPSGRIDVRLEESLDGPFISAQASEPILAAFEKGRGSGVLFLGASNAKGEAHPTLSYWQGLGRAFVSSACGLVDPLNPSAQVLPDADADELDAFVQSAPPMRGAEYITSELLFSLWEEMGRALGFEASKHKEGVQGFLKQLSSVWNVVGRVCLHLAENKRDPEFPFAFLATYAHKVSKKAEPAHLPLGRALQEFQGAKNQKALLALLAPLSRAAEESGLIRELFESGDIYHPLPWTSKEAHRFLREIPIYERAGLVVRVPSWWSKTGRPRPKVKVTVGEKTPSALGVDAILSFDVQVVLAGQTLSQSEIEALIAKGDGLRLIKGDWVEVDEAELRKMLDHWRAAERRAKNEGIDFREAMRLTASFGLDSNDPVSDEEVLEWSEVVAGKWLKERLETLRSPKIRLEIERGAGLDATLRPYQKVGVEWLFTLRGLGLGGCLADDMGLGKTIQVIGLLSLSRRNGDARCDLLVVPASLVDNWRLEIERFAPFLKVLIAHPSRLSPSELKALSAERINAFDAVITTYGTVMRVDSLKEYSWRNVVLDEAQAVKNPAAKQTRAVKALRSDWRLALTGTPVENRLSDLWSIFDFLNPGLLGSAKTFGALTKSMASSARGYAPLRRLVSPYILRRLKTDKSVIADLPDKTELDAPCLLSKRQAALYRQSVDEMAEALSRLDGIERRGVVLSFLLRFKQICNHPSQWLGDGAFEPGESGKLLRLGELCESIAARQDKVLVFTQFREMTEPLADFLSGIFGRPGAVLHGGTPIQKRQELVNRFQENDRVPFMVLSLKAGGTGLNLTAASHVIHFDRWWNPSVENQATDRAFRIGQKKNVLVHKFVCKGTVEERIDALIASKKELAGEILEGGAESTLTELSNEELISMVSLDLSRAVEQ